MNYQFERHYLSCKVLNLRKLARKIEDRINEEMLQFGMTYQRFIILWKIIEINGRTAKDIAKGLGFFIPVRLIYRQLEEMQTMGFVFLGRQAPTSSGKIWEPTKEGKRVFKICYTIWDEVTR